MSDSYWDLYVAYIAKCVKENKEQDIDPHHYEMEWNHFLPQCIFGDQPLGQYLSLKQHAIATALQTLALKKNCMCGWHKKYLPDTLLEASWGYFISRNKQNGKKVMKVRHLEKDELGRSLDGVRNAERLNAEKTKEGKSINAIKGAAKLNQIIHAERDEFGRSVFAMSSLANTYQGEKDERGVPLARIRNGERLHSEKDEFGRSVAAMNTNNQVWESTMDGFKSNPGCVARHNKLNGWDPKARIRVS
jgi:hypothetical protein